MNATEVADNLNAFLALPAAIRSFCQQLSGMPEGDKIILAVIVLVAVAILAPTALALIKKSIELLEWFGTSRRIQQLTDRIKEGWLTPAQTYAYEIERLQIETQAAIGVIRGAATRLAVDHIFNLISASDGHLTIRSIKTASRWLTFNSEQGTLLSNTGSERKIYYWTVRVMGWCFYGTYGLAALFFIGLFALDAFWLNPKLGRNSALSFVPLWIGLGALFMTMMFYLLTPDLRAIKKITPILKNLQPQSD